MIRVLRWYFSLFCRKEPFFVQICALSTKKLAKTVAQRRILNIKQNCGQLTQLNDLFVVKSTCEPEYIGHQIIFVNVETAMLLRVHQNCSSSIDPVQSFF